MPDPTGPLLAAGTGTLDPAWPGLSWQDDASDTPDYPLSAARMFEATEQVRGLTALLNGDVTDLPVTLGAGGNLGYFDTGVAGVGLTLYSGSSTTPVTVAQPSLKVNRYEEMLYTAGFINGAVVERNSCITAIVQNTVNSEVQATALTGYATSRSTKTHPTHDPDSCGVNGVGRISAGGVGYAMGAFFEGARESDTGNITALQLQTRNLGSAVSHGTAGINACVGIWLVAASSQAGTGLMLGHPTGYGQFDVGIGFQSNDGGAVKTAAFWDATQALQSIRVGGAHANGAIAVESGSGGVVIGSTAPQFAAQLEVLAPNNTSGNPLVVFGEQLGSDSQVVQFRNQSGVLRIGPAASGGFGVTGAAAGDGIVQQFTTGTSLHIAGTSAKVLTVTAAGTFGAYGVTPVAKPGNLTLSNYTVGSRTLDLSSYTLADVANFVAQMYKNNQSLGWVT